ncbi:MAG: TonB-dependent receptor, partial [Pseudomonadota bacterium]
NRSIDYINQAPAGALLNNLVNGIGEANYFSLRPGDVNGFAAAVGAGPADVVAPDASQLDDDNITGKATIDWQATEDLLVYATWSRGFKAGGFNAGFLDQTDFITSDLVKFDNEVLTSYEGGFKWTAPNGLIRVNASGFYYDYEDFQALTFQGLSQFITNGDATFFGGEAEVGVRPIEGLDAQFGISLLDTDVDGVTVQGVTLNNREAVLAPNVTANGFIRYGLPVWAGELAGTFSFNYQGEHFFDITNSDLSKEDGYVLFDMRIEYEPEDSFWEIAFFGRNLTDKEYRVYTFDFTGPAGFNQQFFGPPRWWGGSVSVRF